MFKEGQQLAVVKDGTFVLYNDNGEATKWAIQDDIVEVCNLVGQRENEEEYMVRIISYHADFFGFDPSTPLHMIVPYTKRDYLQLVFDPATMQLEEHTNVDPFQVHDYVHFTGQAWNMLNENGEKIGKYLTNTDRFSVEEVVFHGEDDGYLYRINIARGFDKFEPAYIYVKGADKEKYFTLTDHLYG